jgi:hypothetical protein
MAERMKKEPSNLFFSIEMGDAFTEGNSWLIPGRIS